MIRINLLKPQGTSPATDSAAAPRTSILTRREALIGVVLLALGTAALVYLATRPDPTRRHTSKPVQAAAPQQPLMQPQPVAPAVNTPAPPAASTPAAPAPAPCRVTDLSAQQQPGAMAVSVLTGVEPKHEAFELSAPYRLVVDLPGCRVEPSASRTLDLEHSVLEKVRASQFRLDPDVGRVVLDLKSPPKYEIRTLPAGLEIRISGGGS